MKRLLILLAMLSLLSGCLTETDHGDEANKLITVAHQAFKNHDWDQVTPYYDKLFLKEHSAASWKAEVSSLTKNLGTLNNVRPTFLHHDPRFGGDFYLYGFILQFEHGSIYETLTIYKDDDKKHLTISGQDLKLQRHP